MAAVRLQRLKEEYGDKVTIVWKSFPLIPVETQRQFTPYIANAWQRAGESEPSINFNPWDEMSYLPSCSMPALEAAKCAALQGEDAFERYHRGLMKAYFEQRRDISQRQMLIDLAGEIGLDKDRFVADLDSGVQKAEVLAEWKESLKGREFGGIPTAFFNDRFMLEGAVPIDLYRRGVELLLKEDC